MGNWESFTELNQKWSPEQIAGVGKTLGYLVSHEWIYGYLQLDKLHGISNSVMVDVYTGKAAERNVSFYRIAWGLNIAQLL